jgi:GNAT superfamily N-acetyltransferase
MTDKKIPDQLPSGFSIEWRGAFENAEVNSLHAECFEHESSATNWWLQLNHFSLGWVCIRKSRELVGFVNVAWDGGAHAFVLDTMVVPAVRGKGIATALIMEAINRGKQSGCEWLHVDFGPHLRAFYFDACGFNPTDAGLVSLK